MPKIKNPYYRQFLENQYIELVEQDQFTLWLDGIKDKKIPPKSTIAQARALFISIYYTGRRPSEVVSLKPEDINKVKEGKKYYIKLNYLTLKRGLRNTIWLPYNKHTKEMYNYVKNLPPGMFVFYSFRSPTKNNVSWNTKKEILIKENGKLSREVYSEKKSKCYERLGNKVNFYCLEWSGRNAYFFRHNRFSLMYSNGANDNQVQLFKGAKDPKSVNPYKHMSKKMAKDITKLF